MLKYTKIICMILLISLSVCSCSVNRLEKHEDYKLQKKTQNFLFYCSDENVSQIDTLMKKCNMYFDDFSKKVNTDFNKKIKIIIYPNEETFNKSNSESSKYLNCDTKKSEIRITSLDITENVLSSEKLYSKLNEYILQIMLTEINKDIPTYLMFGFLESGAAGDEKFKSEIVSKLRSSEFSTIDKLNSITSDKEFNINTLLDSITLVKYILDEYGYDKFVELVKNNSYQEVFNISESEFEKSWLYYTKLIYDDHLDFSKATEHFIVYYTQSDEDSADEVGKVLEDNYERLTTNLRVNLAKKINITLYPNADIFHKANSHIQSGDNRSLLGCATIDGIRMISPNSSNSNPIYNHDYLLKAAVHEFIHVLTDEINKDIPNYLNEGIAQYESGIEEGVMVTIVPLLRQSRFPTVQQLSNMNTLDNPEIYQYGYTFVEYVVKTYGYKKLIEFIRSTDINGVFGVNETEFEKNWTDFLKKAYYP